VPGNYIDNLATSFNGNKIITSSGGGAIGCNDAKMFEKISYWINQSKSALESYHHEEIGYNYRLSNVHAAIGYAQILKIDEFIEKRRMIRNFYNTFFKENNLGITVLMDSNEQTSNAWLTVIKFTGENCENTRDKVKNTLDLAGIETRLIWKPMSCQPVFKKYESITNQFSIKAFHQSLCLPSHPGLSINDLELVVTKIEESLKL
jgi:dTDP-4-amino-4,6-dideoxygalactose transaminase